MKAEKQENLAANINKKAKDLEIKEKSVINKGSDKVPEHAKLVVDNEG